MTIVYDTHGQPVCMLSDPLPPAPLRPYELHPQYEQVRTALYTTAERMGANNYNATKKGRRFVVTVEHKEVIDALRQLEAGEIDPESAMAVLAVVWKWTRRVVSSRSVAVVTPGRESV